MKNRRWICLAAAVGAIALLWLVGVVPRQIARIYGTYYGREHFPEMGLGCTGVQWADAYGGYVITWRSGEGKGYSCVMGPRYFPVSMGQGLFEMESDCEEYYQ